MIPFLKSFFSLFQNKPFPELESIDQEVEKLKQQLTNGVERLLKTPAENIYIRLGTLVQWGWGQTYFLICLIKL